MLESEYIHVYKQNLLTTSINYVPVVSTSSIRTPKGQNQVSALQRCPYYRGRECMIFGISGTERTVRKREASVV